jgi:tetrahydromethanopterin S-methyltransferase subunit G
MTKYKDKNLNVPDEFNNIYKVLNKLEQRIATLEKVIGKLQLRLGDVVLYIDKKGEENELERSNN